MLVVEVRVVVAVEGVVWDGAPAAFVDGGGEVVSTSLGVVGSVAVVFLAACVVIVGSDGGGVYVGRELVVGFRGQVVSIISFLYIYIFTT